MEAAQQISILDVTASNANFTGEAIPVVAGSDVRAIIAITAITGSPASNWYLETQTDGNDWVVLATVALASAATATLLAEIVGRRIRLRMTQAGGANNITASADLIIQPPNLPS